MNQILTTAQMAKADAFAVAHGVPSLILMENAGRAVADAIAARFKPCPVTVLCGPGNNGGDGFVVARLLDEEGFTVRVAQDADHRGDARTMSEKWKGAREALTPAALEGARLVVDALFGAGLSRPLDGAYAQIVEALNNLPVAAVDIPSGVFGDTGQTLGGVYVKAALTVTFFRKKPGHLLLPGRALCGETVVADIGIPSEAANTWLYENTPALWHFPWPRLEGHKYTRGHCVVVSGPAHATGAARLAARAALRVGAGLVSVASPPDALAVNAAHLTAIMLKPFDGAAGLGALLADKRLNAVVIGPGLGIGGEARALVDAVLKSGSAAVLDADALSAFAGDPKALFNVLDDRCVLTPHRGEFERLFPGLLDKYASKVEAVRAAAALAGAVVLLKGADTVIADSTGKTAINANAPPNLATAGAGDVLAGLIAGLLAQGMGAFDAAACGTWLHGDAASRFGPGLIAEDLPEMLPKVLAGLMP
ncbi:MAG TPA: NAD(P)H-hydrate dehydratase [Rhizomicrobium sp.]|nr:NAD(P)H-hydrate dehydratase [Rhizomicrobium sp.]